MSQDASCPIHESATLKPVVSNARDQFFGYGGQFHYLECPDCRSWILSPRPSPDEIGAYYRGYYTDEALDTMRKKFANRRPERADVIPRFRAYGFLRRLDRLGFALGPEMRMLDVGCGLGGFARFVRDMTSAETRGLDFNQRCQEFAKKYHGVEVDVGELSAQQYPDASFDVVTAWHVLEHVYDPVAELTEMSRILKPGGWLMIEVPTNDLVGRVFGRRWVYLQPPTHLYHFRPGALRSLLSGVGLTVEAVRRPWFPGEIASSLMMAFGVDAFLPKLFGSPDRPFRYKLLTLLLYAQMIYDVPLTLLCCLIKRPGLVRVFARKPVSQ